MIAKLSVPGCSNTIGDGGTRRGLASSRGLAPRAFDPLGLRADGFLPGIRRGLPGQLRREHVDLLDDGRPGEEIARLRHERGGDSARQMCLAAGLVRELSLIHISEPTRLLS